MDDSEDMRHLWVAWLTYWGFSVEEASNGADAIRRARVDPPDLIVMDLMMPVVDGFTATSILKAHPDTSHIPILALTAAPLFAARAQAENAGADAFLGKGIAPEEFLGELRALFRKIEPPDGRP